ncbi:protein FAM32A-like [Parus major]|uniref:protein FAM32A-like n=1 Tax=Parus major TaxID=9157 RepID=UPI0014445979|nr:protein FAM32A-like [Parus major]
MGFGLYKVWGKSCSLRTIMERGPLRLKGSGGALGASKRKKGKDKAQTLEQITRRGKTKPRPWSRSQEGERQSPDPGADHKKGKDKAQTLEQITRRGKTKPRPWSRSQEGERQSPDPGADHKKEEEKRGLDKRTPAQAAFQKMQERRQMKRVLNKASKTHKQQVEELNRHLDALTEHYDIPKVSWTK